MKIHINKEKVEKKGFFGGGKSWFVVSAYYELNDEEKTLLNSNKNLLSMEAFDLPFRGADFDPSGQSSPTVKNMTGGKQYPLGSFLSNGEVQEVENIVNEGAKNLKAELYGDSVGTSTTEI